MMGTSTCLTHLTGSCLPIRSKVWIRRAFGYHVKNYPTMAKANSWEMIPTVTPALVTVFLFLLQ
jgi:hypothetical protein